MKNLEIRTIEKHGVKVTLKIDYDKGKVSLVERNGCGFENKKWIFAERELEYMGGWLAVLDAMKYAVEEATKDLERLEKEKAEAMIEMEEQLAKSSELFNKKPRKISKYGRS